jgi:aryl-alcohol dehydrogenase-like predicted oxidoreductase
VEVGSEGGNRRKNIRIFKEFKALAGRKSCSVAQLALAGLLKQGVDKIVSSAT